MKRILVVDDDTDNRDLLTMILAFYGFETARATNGRHAVALARETQPDLIIMDISMPIVNGLDAARQLKANPALAAIPIVALSAYDTRADELAALAAGCAAFLPKPLDLTTLQEALGRILGEEALEGMKDEG